MKDIILFTETLAFAFSLAKYMLPLAIWLLATAKGDGSDAHLGQPATIPHFSQENSTGKRFQWGFDSAPTVTPTPPIIVPTPVVNQDWKPTPVIKHNVQHEHAPDCPNHPKNQATSLEDEFGLPIPQRRNVFIQIHPGLTKAAYKVPQRKTLIGFAPTWCVTCPMIKQRFINNSQLRVQWLDEFDPRFPQLDAYPAIQDPRDDFTFYNGDALNSWASLTNQMALTRQERGWPALVKKPPKLSVGTIDRERVERAIELIKILGGNSGSFTRDDPFDLTSEMFSFSVKPKTVVTWNTAQDGSMRFDFNPRPIVGVSGITQAVTAVVVGQKSLTLKIDWLPDVSLDLR